MKKNTILKNALFGMACLSSSTSFSAETIDLEEINIGAGEISQLKALLSLEPSSELNLELTQELPDGTTRQKFSQRYNDTDIKSAIVTIRVAPQMPSRFLEAHGVVVKGLAQDLFEETSVIGSDAIKELVINRCNLSQEQQNSIKIKRLIELDTNQQAKYVYELNFIKVEGNTISRPFVIIDAKTGALIREWDGMHHAMAPALGSGIGGNEKTQSYRYGTDYEHLSITKEGNRCYLDNDKVMTVDMHYSWDLEQEQKPYSYLCYDEKNTN